MYNALLFAAAACAAQRCQALSLSKEEVSYLLEECPAGFACPAHHDDPLDHVHTPHRSDVDLEAWVEEAWRLFDEGNARGAATLFQDLLEFSPGNHALNGHLQTCYAKLYPKVKAPTSRWVVWSGWRLCITHPFCVPGLSWGHAWCLNGTRLCQGGDHMPFPLVPLDERFDAAMAQTSSAEGTVVEGGRRLFARALDATRKVFVIEQFRNKEEVSRGACEDERGACERVGVGGGVGVAWGGVNVGAVGGCVLHGR
jgi:hypothetical protein